MARVTVEDCVTKVPNRFELVLLASQRAKELSGGAEPTLPRDNDKNSVISLREIEEGTVPVEKIREDFISSMQKYIKVQENAKEEADIAEAEAELASNADDFAYLSEAALASEADEISTAPEEDADLS